MKPDYTDASSKIYGVGKGRMYEREGAFRDPLLPNFTPCLVPQPQILVTL